MSGLSRPASSLHSVSRAQVDRPRRSVRAPSAATRPSGSAMRYRHRCSRRGGSAEFFYLPIIDDALGEVAELVGEVGVDARPSTTPSTSRPGRRAPPVRKRTGSRPNASINSDRVDDVADRPAHLSPLLNRKPCANTRAFGSSIPAPTVNAASRCRNRMMSCRSRAGRRPVPVEQRGSNGETRTPVR